MSIKSQEQMIGNGMQRLYGGRKKSAGDAGAAKEKKRENNDKFYV
ncbi:hypothetical protein HM1_0191 [Heliomicrobium modesticaldum Ice1]|uniref:Uncharacterized protein n=1 Tax=Heliobacterium modesticaldum (strain ATCC 51547 / Ice1) TaxID=498761 RepID=B0TDU6_HELMI|nr:hypothetical protein HM1_0191 [Heliomicrobium modesticaldum Ice1]